MSAIGPESFQRLEEFPSFTSCIKCFGRPIIPPLLIPSRRHELKQLRIAATHKEIQLLRNKKELLNQQAQDAHLIESKTENEADLLSSVQENCALWYPSLSGNREGISVAISKFPTSSIYSSIHTGAIVFSNVIEDSPAYSSRIARDSLYNCKTSLLDCVECSHNCTNGHRLECSLCQAELNQSFRNRSFVSDVGPEVPCRTFSLLQQSGDVADEDIYLNAEETEGESLPTVIANQKYIPPDTDSESNVTLATHSTDLEKYMEFPYEFSSPENNSAAVWDSKSTSQQYTLSRSDDASSETIVNTENELTPCASTMAELTDNIEDEFSNADEITTGGDNKDMKLGTLRRAHSVDSYMKIIQSCARNMNVKKSRSEPFNSNQETASELDYETKTSITCRTGLLIKEDSKESEESKDLPEKDLPMEVNNIEIVLKDNKALESKTNENNSFEKKHIRQNSYTLDHPSSVLILAHADCSCNFDTNCISPHCSALKDKNELETLSAFTKEKVVDIPVSHYHQMKNNPVVSSESSSVNVKISDHLTSTVVDVFPVVEEDCYEKSNSGNRSEAGFKPENIQTIENSRDSNAAVEVLSEKLSEKLNIADGNKHQEYLKHILEEFKEKNKIRAEQLYVEQQRQWLQLQEEFKEQEKLLYEKLNQTILPPDDLLPSSQEKSQVNSYEDCDCENNSECPLVPKKENVSVMNKVMCTEQISTTVDSTIKNSSLTVTSEIPQLCCSPSPDHNLFKNARASISPSTESKNPNNSPSKPLENIKDDCMFKQSDLSKVKKKSFSLFENDDAHVNTNVSESLPVVNGFSSSVTPTLLSYCNNLPHTSNAAAGSVTKCDNCSACSCDKSPKQQYECCSSFNGYCDCDVSDSYPQYLPTFEGQESSSGLKDLRTEADFLNYFQNTAAMGIENRNSQPDDMNNCQKIKDSRKITPQKTNSSVHVTQNFATSNPVLPINNKDEKNGVSLLSAEKSKLPLNNIVSSICTKTLKNGSFPSQDLSHDRKITNNPILMKKFEKLPAFVKGYLTRRLFKTERVQSLIKTLQDTALLIGKLSEDLSLKGDSVSERDVDFHRQLIVQLMTTFHNVYDIFCTISIKEKMNVIAESRNFRFQQKALEQIPVSEASVASKVPDPASSKKHKLSSATLKALERKRRTTIDSRTYTIEDFKNIRSRSAVENRTYTIEDLKDLRSRTLSSMSSKNLSVSPSSIYKASIGLPLKRKTTSIKSSRSRQNLHNKWVP